MNPACDSRVPSDALSLRRAQAPANGKPLYHPSDFTLVQHGPPIPSGSTPTLQTTYGDTAGPSKGRFPVLSQWLLYSSRVCVGHHGPWPMRHTRHQNEVPPVVLFRDTRGAEGAESKTPTMAAQGEVTRVLWFLSPTVTKHTRTTSLV